MRRNQKEFLDNLLATMHGMNHGFASAMRTYQEDSKKDVKALTDQFGKLSVQVTNIQAELQMQNPGNYSQFLSKIPQSEDIQDIGSDYE